MIYLRVICFIVFVCLCTSISHSEPFNDEADYVSQLQSLRSLVENAISLHEERTRDLRAEHSSMRQKIDVQAFKMRQMDEISREKRTPEWAHEFQRQMLNKIEETRKELDGRIDDIHAVAEQRRQKKAKDEDNEERRKKIANIKRQLDEEDPFEMDDFDSLRDGDEFRNAYGYWGNYTHHNNTRGYWQEYTTPSYPEYRPHRNSTQNWGYETTPWYPEYSPHHNSTHNWGYETTPWYPEYRPQNNYTHYWEYETTPNPAYVDPVEDLGNQLQREIVKRTILQSRVKNLGRNLFNLTIDVMELRRTVRDLSNKSHDEPPRPTPFRMRCESGVKSSGEMEPQEITTQHVRFARSFLNTPHVMVGVSMAAEYEWDVTQGQMLPNGPIDFHLRKHRVTPHNFTLEFQSSAGENTFIFASWMACGQSF